LVAKGRRDRGDDDQQAHRAERSKTGEKARHGPHHDAQKSTSTIGLSTIVDSKFARVRLVVDIDFPLK